MDHVTAPCKTTLVRADQGETSTLDLCIESVSSQGWGIKVVLGGNILSQVSSLQSLAKAEEQFAEGVRNFAGQCPALGFKKSGPSSVPTSYVTLVFR